MKKIRFKHEKFIRKPQLLKTTKLNVFVIIILSLFKTQVNAQSGNLNAVLNGCYHQLAIEDGKTYNLLATDKFQFSLDGTGIPDWALVETFDQNGDQLYFDYRNSGLADARFYYPFYQNDILKELVTLYYVDENGVGFTNGNWFTFNSDVKYVKISFYKDFNNRTTLESTFNFKLLQLSEAFSIENIGGESCFSFDNFHAGWSTKIDGFCSYKVYGNLTPTELFDDDIPTSFSLDLNFQESKDLSIIFPEFCLECESAHAPASHPDPQPCKCRMFTLKLIIEPCNGIDYENCEPLEIDYLVNICCECDVRNVVVFD